jgi:putative Mg2+ transporter-C (MgtC) family protein
MPESGTEDPMPTTPELLLRLLLAAAVGGIVGLERELSGQRAGLRTHLLVGLGACVFTEASAFGFQFLAEHPPQTVLDPSRIAAQVVSGIGFLGAGAILRYGINVRGLTTAASLWVVAALGLATALGLYLEVVVGVGLALVALVGLRPIRTRIRHRRSGREELVVEAEPELEIGSLFRPLTEAGVRVENVRIQDQEDLRRVTLLLKTVRDPDRLLAEVASVPGVRDAEWTRGTW